MEAIVVFWVFNFGKKDKRCPTVGDLDALSFLDDLCSFDKMHASQDDVLKYKQFVKGTQIIEEW